MSSSRQRQAPNQDQSRLSSCLRRRNGQNLKTSKSANRLGSRPAKKKPVNKVVERWYKTQIHCDQIEEYLLTQQIAFKKYKLNVFALQKAALKIQHWFYKKHQYAAKIQLRPRPKKMENQDMSLSNHGMKAIRSKIKDSGRNTPSIY